MTKYETIIYWNDADRAFIAEVPELSGCAAEGASQMEALANVHVVAQEWLATANASGRPIPKARGRLVFA